MKRNEKVDADDCAERLKAVADGERLRIVCMLQAGRKNVSEIAEALGSTLVNASHHLKVLRQAGMLTTERSGRNIYYRLADGVFPREPDELDLGCCRLQIEPGKIS